MITPLKMTGLKCYAILPIIHYIPKKEFQIQKLSKVMYFPMKMIL